MVVTNDQIAMKYKKTMYRMTKRIFPRLSYEDMDKAMDHIMNERYKDIPATLNNNYTKKELDITIRSITNYILEKEPICTTWGVLFKKHGTCPNPLTEMIKEFMEQRDIHKKEMFKYPKGTEMFNKYYLLQILDKIDCNAIYGAEGAKTSIYYNINVAASITAQGRSLISSVTMFFEMFLSNNVKFSSLDEVLVFIDHVVSESNNRHYDDKDILDSDISIEDVFAKLVYTCGDFRHGKVKWIPDERDLELIWESLNQLSQEDLNRIYYKNNLLEFIDNRSMTNAIIYILNTLENPYLDPNKVPEEIKVELETFVDLLREYVFYNYQIMDKVDRCNNMVKNVCVISDTDSAIVCLDGWYRYILEKVKGYKFKITNIQLDEFNYVDKDKMVAEESDTVLDYDFYRDEIIETKRLVELMKIIPQDGLRYSIINIISHVCGVLVNEYMLSYTKQTHSYMDGKKCLIISKNEFLMKRALLTMAKKNYATKLEIQEGNMVPNNMDSSLDIKGLPITKSTMSESAKEKMKKILYEDILNCAEIDQLKVIKDLAIIEKQIFQSLQSGNKEYYKPASIKAMSRYDDPMRIQGVKASYIWNIVKDDNLEAIDLNSRNTIGIIKVDINERNVDRIKDSYPETYEKILSVLRNNEIQKFNDGTTGARKRSGVDGEITSLAIPVDIQTPKWVMEFIDYTTIINDCLSNFPIESIGINKMNRQSVNYTNIISL